VGRGWRKGSRIVEFTFHKQLSFAVWKERETEREREREKPGKSVERYGIIQSPSVPITCQRRGVQ
jgi:hypothetical protein